MSTITVKFFAQIRERLNTEMLILDAHCGETMAMVQARLCERNNVFNDVLSNNVLMACNQTLVGPEHRIKQGDEIAFFPPVTGG